MSAKTTVDVEHQHSSLEVISEAVNDLNERVSKLMRDVVMVASSSGQADAEMTSLQQVLTMSEFAVNQLVGTIT